MRNKGFALIPVIIVAAIISLLSFSLIRSGVVKNVSLVKTPVPEVSLTPQETITPTPTATVVATSAPSPTATKTSTATPKPTPIPVSGPPGSGLSTINVATERGNFSATVLSLDLGSTRVITDTASDGDCGDNCPVMNLQSYVTRNNGFAAVNGTYFCPATYAECAGKTNSFDFPVYNTRLGHWVNAGNLFWNGRAMIYFEGTSPHYLQNANSYPGGGDAGIVNYPGLVNGGQVQIDDNQSGLSDKQKAVGTKVGIGIRGGTVMVVVAKSVNMQQFAYVFKSLGASGALNLDTGGSTALYYNGRYVYGPGRDLPNSIIFASR